MQLWRWMFNSQKPDNDMMLGDKPPPQGSLGFWYVLAISIFFEDWCRIIMQLCDHKISYHALPRTPQKSPSCLKQFCLILYIDDSLSLFNFLKLRHRSRTRCFVEENWGSLLFEGQTARPAGRLARKERQGVHQALGWSTWCTMYVALFT